MYDWLSCGHMHTTTTTKSTKKRVIFYTYNYIIILTSVVLSSSSEVLDSCLLYLKKSRSMNEESRLLPSPSGKLYHHNYDAVMLAAKQLIDTWTCTVLLWLLSFILIMTNFISKGAPAISQSILYVPMWVGSFCGIISLILVTKKLCSVSRLVTEEQVEFLEEHVQNSFLDYIEYESLPLLRYFIFYVSVSGLGMVLVFISQVYQ